MSADAFTYSRLTISDLNDEELDLIFRELSVRQLFNCLTVCKRWQPIIERILKAQTTLTLIYNDVIRFNKEGNIS